MNLFFALLPADVLKDILHVWLFYPTDRANHPAKILSRLDAICPNTHRRHLYSVFNQLPPFKGLHVDHYLEEIYLCWLHTRTVPMKALQLFALHINSNNSHLTLPTVETIEMWTDKDINEYGMGVILRRFPNVTELSNRGGFTLPSNMVTKLHTIKATPNKNTCFTPIGCQIQELRLTSCVLDANLANTISNSCPMLRYLHVYATNATDILIILQGCQYLTELAGGYHKLEECEQILAYRQILRFECSSRYCGGTFRTISLFSFRNILVQNPSLEYLKLDACEYSRLKGKLILDRCSEFSVHGGFLEDIFKACSPVKELRISGHILYCDFAELIVSELGYSLERLEVSVGPHSHRALQMVLTNCKLLNSIVLTGTVTDNELQFLADNCPQQLATLSHFELDITTVTDEGLATFISCCSAINKLILRGAYTHLTKTLQAMRDCKLPLNCIRLQLRYVQRDADEAFRQFRQQAKVKQLLPVPTIFGL